MKIKIERLKSGFYCVFVNGSWVNASLESLEAAKKYASYIMEAENKYQNSVNRFSNISLEVCC